MTVILGKRGDPGPAGWTQVIASEPSGEGVAFTGTGTRKVYVSSSTGNDTTGNGTQAAPYATVGKGLSGLRSGSPDHLHFKRGDTWLNAHFGRFGRNGKSADEPLCVRAYGTGARPLFIPPSPQQAGAVVARISNDAGQKHTAWLDLDFYKPQRDFTNPQYDAAASGDGSTCFQMGGSAIGGNWGSLIIENCVIRNFAVGIQLSAHDLADGTPSYTGGHYNKLIVRRNQIIRTTSSPNRWDAGGHGILVDHIEDALYEECFIHYAGMDPLQPKNFRSTYYHGLYLQASTGVVHPTGEVRPGNSIVRDNIITWASFNGVWHRCGGTCENNYITNCGSGIGMGYAAGTPPTLVNLVKNNVIQASMGHNGGPHTTDVNGAAAHRGIEPGSPGWGITLWPSVHPGRVTGNIVSNSDSNGISGLGISFGTTPEVSNNPCCHGWTADNNIVSKWTTLAGGVDSQSYKYRDNSNATFGPPNTIDATNKISMDGIKTTDGVTFVDGKRTILTYDKDVLGGPGTLNHFADLYLSKMDRDSWDPKLTAKAVNDYVRAGHNIGTVVVEPPPPPPPPPPPDATQAVTSLTVVRADTGADIATLGATLDIGALPSFSVRANTTPATVGSVEFKYDGAVIRTEAVAPYSINGDVSGAYTPWLPALGSHTLVVTPISSTGVRGTALTLALTVVNSTVVVPPPPPPDPIPVPPPPVTTPPTVAITTPANGTVIRGNGSVTISANANRAGTIAISADGMILQTCIGGTSCSVTWPGKAISQAMHTITAKVTDAAGLSGTASISIRKR